MTDHEIMLKAANCERLLNDVYLKEALEGVELAAVDIWKNSATGEQDKRESAYRTVFAVRALRAQLQTYFDAGKILKARNEDTNGPQPEAGNLA